MNKQLIYTDITKVLYMMKNHGIRFESFNRYWGTWSEVTLTKLIKSAEAYKSDKFRVHPDDVAKFEPADRDIVKTDIGLIGSNLQNDFVNVCVGKNSLSSYSLDEMKIAKILERDGKAWLAPDPAREA